MPSLLDALPADPDESALYEAFAGWAESQGRPLYPHQEEALLALVAGDHVIAATPTGSGKSTIGFAALFCALAQGRQAYYTAPIKALVSEKFFELVALFGADSVGMMTGDAAVNTEAPIIVCTAEILANHSLRDGETSDVALAVMDEFHFYGDPQRGWAWQVPLLELPAVQFVLMSATLGDVSFFEEDLAERTGRDVSTIQDAPRPVPLDFRYAETPVPDTIAELLADRDAPIYVVHFAQKDAIEQATSLLGVPMLSRDEKAQIAELIGDFRFSKGFGKQLSKLVRHGIGVHHAGMLPKYRRLVEKLAQSGLLKVICGTDTLGVGINVPIRTVLLTALAKFDGRRSRLLNAREFHQIAGRAGRAGYDTIGHVVVQAPSWTIAALKKQAKAEKGGQNNAKKAKKGKEAKPQIPEGAVNWTQANFEKLVAAEPEPLTPRMQVSAAMLLALLERPGDAVANARRLLYGSHVSRSRKVQLAQLALRLLRGLLDSDVVEVLPAPDHLGRNLVVAEDLQGDFALNQPLAPFAIAVIDSLEDDSPTLTVDTVSVIEAILEDPRQVLFAQQRAARSRLFEELRADGVEYVERQRLLDDVTWPQPLKDDLEHALELYRKQFPWVSPENLSPKSIVREMYETGQTFSEYVSRYQLARSEGILLRYLSDAYQALRRTLPEGLRTDDLEDLIEWLDVLVRGVDSSLLDEWEALTHPETDEDATATVRSTGPALLSAQTKVLNRMVRAAMWHRVELFSHEREQLLGLLDGESGWTQEKWGAAMDDFFADYDDVGIDGAARSPQLLQIDRESKVWRIRQVLDDPAGDRDWAITAELDLAATDEEGEPVLTVTGVGPMG